MSRKIQPISEVAQEMRSMAKFLMPHTFPLVEPEVENDINYFKTRDVIVDGYELILYFSRAKYPTHQLETVQITGKYAPFLPFRLVCKIGRKFLGERHLGFVEFFATSRRKYVWTLALDLDGNPTSSPYKSKSEHRTFDGLEYSYMDPKEVNFY